MMTEDILTATWCNSLYWELIGGNMSVSRVSCKLGGLPVFFTVYWDPPGGTMSGTRTLKKYKIR